MKNSFGDRWEISDGEGEINGGVGRESDVDVQNTGLIQASTSLHEINTGIPGTMEEEDEGEDRASGSGGEVRKTRSESDTGMRLLDLNYDVLIIIIAKVASNISHLLYFSRASYTTFMLCEPVSIL